jgi:virginiamycin B lyase
MRKMRARIGRAVLVMAVVGGLAVVRASAAAASVGTITEFSDGFTPIGITNGPDNQLYIAEHQVNMIGKMNYDGLYPVAPFPVPTPGTGPFHITTGWDNQLWYTDLLSGSVGLVTTTGTVLPDIKLTPHSGPLDVRRGPDGTSMWVTENFANQIARIYPRLNGGGCGVDGHVSGDYCVVEYPTPTVGSAPGDIAVGPDGNMWFTETNVGEIGRITASGAITEFALPDPNSRPEGIVTGPDGNLWFTMHDTVRIGKMNRHGNLLAQYDGLTGAGPTNIIVGPDNALWFPEEFNPGPDPSNLPPGDKIGRITTTGALTEYTTPTAGSRPVIITAGHDGNLWFTEVFANQVGRLSLY